MVIEKPARRINHKVILTASKSESNRALIIQALCSNDFNINNLAIAEDTQTLLYLLHTFKQKNELDAGPAGTTFRFLTAFLSTQTGSWKLTGSERMLERPIGILVGALRELGANIEYLEKEGFPPLKINGSIKEGNNITIDGSVSSQFISALLLIAPTLKKGLCIRFTSECTSRPYVAMTLSMMNYFGIHSNWEGDTITVKQGKYIAKDILIEADWSAASYWYEIASLSPGCEIELAGLHNNSLQGDIEVVSIFEKLGVETTFQDRSIVLNNTGIVQSKIEIDMQNCPDLAQTVICTCAALGIEANISGLKTLRIKETDRSLALQTELQKLGIAIDLIGDERIVVPGGQTMINSSVPIETYHDHRMAMAFAPLSIVTEKIDIIHPTVVRKSYPKFWNDLQKAGFKCFNK